MTLNPQLDAHPELGTIAAMVAVSDLLYGMGTLRSPWVAGYDPPPELIPSRANPETQSGMTRRVVT